MARNTSFCPHFIIINSAKGYAQKTSFKFFLLIMQVVIFYKHLNFQVCLLNVPSNLNTENNNNITVCMYYLFVGISKITMTTFVLVGALAFLSCKYTTLTVLYVTFPVCNK